MALSQPSHFVLSTVHFFPTLFVTVCSSIFDDRVLEEVEEMKAHVKATSSEKMQTERLAFKAEESEKRLAFKAEESEKSRKHELDLAAQNQAFMATLFKMMSGASPRDPPP